MDLLTLIVIIIGVIIFGIIIWIARNEAKGLKKK